MSLHAGEVPVDETAVRALLAEQAPALAGLPVRRIDTTGTVNHVFRLGEDLVVRLPRLPGFADDLRREAALLPLVARALPVQVPEVVAMGGPGAAFPLPWLVARWLEGEVAEPGALDPGSLADAVLALRAISPDVLPPAGRPTAAESDGPVRAAIDALDPGSRGAVTRAWEAALEAPEWTGERVAVHADLLPPNLLVRDGRLAGIIDWGSAGAGDPANDLVPAWSCFRGADRERWRRRLGADDGTWARARGIALAQAVVGIPYYRRTNPRFAGLCRATLAEVLAG